MTGLIVEFADDVTEDEEGDLNDDPEVREGWIRVPRSRYLALLSSAQKVRTDWIFREGADFICDTCKSFIIPAKALLRTLLKMGNISLNDPETFQCDLICHYLTKPFHISDDEWKESSQDIFSQMPFIHDNKGGLICSVEGDPLYLAYDEVVFKFRRKCVCDGIYARMYENLAGTQRE